MTHKVIVETMSNLVINHPFFAVYLYDLMSIKEVDKDSQINTAATDGKSIFINTDWFEKLTIKERVFVLAHEVGHGMFQHCQRAKLYKDRTFGPDLKEFNFKKWNQAGDYVINDCLIESHIGTMPCGDNQGLHHPDFKSSDLVDDVYCKLPDPEDDDPENFDDHLDLAPDAPGEGDIKRVITNAKNAAKAMGKLPGALERLVGEILDPKQNWPEILRDYMMIVAGNHEASFAKLHRRKLVMPPHVIYPGTTGFGCKHVVLINDTSGSVSQEETSAYMGEQLGILEDCNPERIDLLWVDSKVHEPVITIERGDDIDLSDVKPLGGGGTDMTAGFRYIDEKAWTPDVVVVLTDGYTPFGEEPMFPVVWVTTGEKDIPYGKVIELEV